MWRLYVPGALNVCALAGGSDTIVSSGDDLPYGIAVDPSNRVGFAADYKGAFAWGAASVPYAGARDVFAAQIGP